VYNQIFFTNILRLLEERGMTKHDLADQAHISISFLSDLSNGKANPSLKIMAAIAEALETPLPTLLEWTDLDQESLDALAGGKAPCSLPKALNGSQPFCRNTKPSSSRNGTKLHARSCAIHATERSSPGGF
jgi:transcriptional regulator with XRE-family HTH domain